VNVVLIPDDPDYRGFFITIVYFPFMLFGAIFSIYCMRLIWNRTKKPMQGRYLYRLFACVFELLTVAPLIHFGFSMALALIETYA